MSSISAGTSAGTALVQTGDTTGALVIKTGGSATTAATFNADQTVTLAQPLPVASGGTGGSATPTAGGVAYGNGTTQAYTSAGTSGQVLTSSGSGAPTWAAAASATVQTFTSSGTWTKPSGANFVMVEVLAAGGGGGSGRRGASLSDRVGGGGGGGGAFVSKTFIASQIGSKVTVTVGAGGAGGAARTTNSTSGANGSTGGQSAFGGYLRAWGGTGGGGGSNSFSNPGYGGGLLNSGNAPYTSLSSGNDYIPGAFARSQGRSGNYEWPGSGFGGGAGGFSPTASTTQGGESSVFAGGGGGCGGNISGSGDVLYNSTKGGGNFQRTALSGWDIQNCAKAVNGLPKFGGAGGSASDGALTYPFNFNVTAYGNSTFLVIDNSNSDQYAIQTSTDSGVTWTQNRIGLAVQSILWDGSRWVALSIDGGIYTTTDFVTWTTVGNCGDIAGGLNMYNLGYYNGTYVVVGGSGYIQTSTDLVAWSTQTSGVTSDIYQVIHDGTRWIACGGASYVGIFLTSTDATTWTNLSANLPANNNVYKVASSGSTYVIGTLDNGSSPALYYSTNGGTSWTDTAASGWGATATGAVYAGGKFLFANQGQIYYSTTGTSFTSGYSASPNTLGVDQSGNSLASDGTTYICSTNYTGTYAAVTSNNATSWTLRSAGYGLPATAGDGGNGGVGGGGGGGGASLNGINSGAGGTGGNGLVRVYTW